MSKSTDVTIQLPDGEVLQGQLTLLNKKPDDFGALYKDAGEFIPSKGTPGTGELAGDKGTQMNCEFFRGAAGGEGICKTTNGALYKFRFAN
jgi:hypothetical protein